MKPSIVLVGGGGHCKAVIDVIKSINTFHIAGIIDPNPKFDLGFPILGSDNHLSSLVQKFDYFLITLGAIKNTESRKVLFDKIKYLGGHFPVIKSPHAYISPTAKIAEGTVVMHKSIINADVVIGKNNIINTGAIIEHDVKIGNHNHISTGAILNGEASLGNSNLLGTRSVIIERINITNDIVLGAGSLVIKNIINPGVYFGSPAIRKV